MEDYRARNLARWDELVPIHYASGFYDVDGFKCGKALLCEIELEEVGPVAGKKLLHLLCHFGLGTLTWARLGAQATGVDYSPAAVERARLLSGETGLPAEFICSDVYGLAESLHGEFDIVFSSYGVLIWLHDLGEWARAVARCLRPGGFFYLVDEHPFALTLKGEGRTENLRLAYPYFDRPEPVRYVVRGSYADRQAQVKNNEVFLWLHSLSGVLDALISAGLRIEFLHEFPYCVYPMFEGMVKDDRGRWRLDGPESLPYLFSVKAVKE